MNIAEIEQQVKDVLLNSNQQNFLFDLLLAYGKPKASINRLQTTGSSSYNLSKEPGVVLWKSNVCFVPTTSLDLDSIVDEYRERPAVAKHKPRFIFATNFDRVCAYDMQTEEHLDVPFLELPSQFAFFLPWAGMEKAKIKEDSPADVKAAEKMAKLYDLILADNPESYAEESHSLNVFLSRVLFCFFAEDTEIFSKKLFSSSVESHTAKDGSDLKDYLQELFRVLDESDRNKVPAYLKSFPYVNGGLFQEHHEAPKFTKRSRDLLIACGADLDWSEISPDIFGSMFQAVVDVEQRGNMGMHYTSVANIMKVIEPLFLNDLYAEFEKGKSSQKKLQELQKRLANIKIFDPACGSGNFLIIAYKEMRKLEMEIINQLSILNKQLDFGLSSISLQNFYGIELDDFAHEIGLLSLWLAEHQMNLAFHKKFGRSAPPLPLKPNGNIVCGNAASEDWRRVCRNSGHEEIYVLGNPPYLGARQQSAEQKSDIEEVFPDLQGRGDLDYISVWFFKAAAYIASTQAKFAFVSTNSITQGVQVALLWPALYEMGLEIFFAHLSFKWENSAKKNAAVICVIVGMRQPSGEEKTIFRDELAVKAKNINAYLADAEDVIVYARKQPLSALPPINYGSFALDDGNYTLSAVEANAIKRACPTAAKFIRPFLGARELLHGEERYCLWLESDLNEALKCKPIRERYERVKQWRSESDRTTTRKLASTAHLFAEVRQPTTNYIAIPTVSSERRKYLPIDFLTSNVVASNQIYVIPGGSPTVFGLLASRLHMIWIEAVGGKLKNDYRYSSALLYNNFAVPKLTAKSSDAIAVCVKRILQVREANSELTLAKLYDPELMPGDLLEAHKRLDSEVEGCYGLKAGASDADRLTALMKSFTSMGGTRNA